MIMVPFVLATGHASHWLEELVISSLTYLIIDKSYAAWDKYSTAKAYFNLWAYICHIGLFMFA
jgi:hypothetical protein